MQCKYNDNILLCKLCITEFATLFNYINSIEYVIKLVMRLLGTFQIYNLTFNKT